MKNKSQKVAFFLLTLSIISTNILAQCFLKTSTQYNPANKITAQINNTYDSKLNLIERKLNGANIYQSQAFLEYDSDNTLITTAFKNGDKTLKTTNSVSNPQTNKDTKTNAKGEKSTEEIVSNGNTSIKTSKDAQGKTSRVETSILENGKLIKKEITNAQNQIVSRETFTYTENNKIRTSTNFDALLDQSIRTENTYNSDNQIIKSETSNNSVIQSSVNYTYQNSKLARKETLNAKAELVHYQTFEYSKNIRTESNFYAGVLHSKIITTFDNKNNPVELRVFNEKQNLIQKTVNIYICK